MYKTFAIAASTALLATTAIPTFAADGPSRSVVKTTETHMTATHASVAGMMTETQAIQKISAMGYTDISGLSLDKSDNVWDAKAMKLGKQYDLEVNASTGAIVKAELED